MRLATVMENHGAIAVPRPKRWDEPMDPQMSDSDVAWLRSRQPFASMDRNAMPRSMPLEGILKNDCRKAEKVTGGINRVSLICRFVG